MKGYAKGVNFHTSANKDFGRPGTRPGSVSVAMHSRAMPVHHKKHPVKYSSPMPMEPDADEMGGMGDGDGAMKKGVSVGKLNAAKRNALPASTFAGPDRSYPVPDKSHAANAKARATQAVNAGRMSAGQKAAIDAKANRVLKK